jgi:TPR repeat protein
MSHTIRLTLALSYSLTLSPDQTSVQFTVRKAVLIDKLGLFQADPALLSSSEYCVRSSVTHEAFVAFVRFLQGAPFSVDRSNVACLRLLTHEFGWDELSDICDSFEKSSGDRSFSGGSASGSVIDRVLLLEEQRLFLERSLAHEVNQRRRLSETVKSLSAAVDRLSSQLSEQAKFFKGQQQYRHGCEYSYGTNSYAGTGAFMSEGLGLCLLRASADAGPADAQFQVGRGFMIGRGCARDPRAGLEYLRRSADAGNSSGAAAYGECLFQMDGGADAALGVEYLRRSVAQGNATGQAFLGLKYAAGQGVEKDPMRGVELAKRSADQGSSMGMLGYGGFLMEGIGCPADPSAGASLVKRAAVHGLPDAQFQYARLLEHGTGVEQDLQRALHFSEFAMDRLRQHASKVVMRAW